MIGEKMDAPGFIPSEAYLKEDNMPLKNFQISNTIRIGSDVLGVGMNLSQDVTLTITGARSNTQYYIFTSEDGIEWERHSYTPVMSDASGVVQFDTNHFSLFTLAEVPSIPVCTLQTSAHVITDGGNINLTWNTLGADTVTLSPGIGNVAISGSLSITPPSGTTTNYVLQSTNAQ
jgi:hypothetical protein